MSSILKALKQLESESDAQRPAAGLPGAWRDRPTTGGAPPPSRFRKINRRLILGAGIGIGIVVLAVVFLFGNPVPESPDSAPVAYRVSAPVPPQPPPPAESSQTIQRTLPGTNSLPQSVGKVPAPPGAEPPPAPQTLPQQGSDLSERAAAPKPPEARRTIAVANTPQRRPLPQARAPETAPQPTAPRAPERSDPRISVQAIAWSQEPAQRMAVINGNIMLEGESVEGIQVKTIEKDGIVFTEAGRWWKQGP